MAGKHAFYRQESWKPERGRSGEIVCIMTENYPPTIIALLEKPSTESFGMVGLIVKINDTYETRGLASGNVIVTPYELNNQLGGIYWKQNHLYLPA